ncbi:hypothetical protein [Arthrobacter sp. TMN-50]
MIQYVPELHLADYPSICGYDSYEFERQSREAIDALAPDSFVRLHVGQYKPQTSPEFFRTDLIWQIVGRTHIVAAWREAMEGAPRLAEF